jgi:RNA polymerase sigma factor (sigma-70 family)
MLRVANPAPASVVAPAEFEQMYTAAWPRLCRYVRVLVRHREDAEDVASETIRRAHGAWQSGRGPAGDPIPWLFLIARRIVIDANRHSPLHLSPISQSDDRLAAPDPFGRIEAAAWFDQIRGWLSPREYEAIVLRYLFDFSDDQSARIMGLSQAGVRTNISRGIATLRKHPEVLDR